DALEVRHAADRRRARQSDLADRQAFHLDGIRLARVGQRPLTPAEPDASGHRSVRQPQGSRLALRGDEPAQRCDETCHDDHSDDETTHGAVPLPGFVMWTILARPKRSTGHRRSRWTHRVRYFEGFRADAGVAQVENFARTEQSPKACAFLRKNLDPPPGVRPWRHKREFRFPALTPHGGLT